VAILDEIDKLVEKFGDIAYKQLEYRTHYENGGVSPWYPCLNNKFIYDNIGKLEFAYKSKEV
jgi:hypothetical protein